MSDFPSAYNAVHNHNPSLGYHTNMAITMRKLWDTAPEHRDTIRTSVNNHLRVEGDVLEDKPFMRNFHDLIGVYGGVYKLK